MIFRKLGKILQDDLGGNEARYDGAAHSVFFMNKVLPNDLVIKFDSTEEAIPVYPFMQITHPFEQGFSIVNSRQTVDAESRITTNLPYRVLILKEREVLPVINSDFYYDQFEIEEHSSWKIEQLTLAGELAVFVRPTTGGDPSSWEYEAGWKLSDQAPEIACINGTMTIDGTSFDEISPHLNIRTPFNYLRFARADDRGTEDTEFTIVVK